MGVKLGGGLLRCGTCGKPRGITHTCVTRATSRRRKTRTKLQPRLTVTCTTCNRVPRHPAHVPPEIRLQGPQAQAGDGRAAAKAQGRRRRAARPGASRPPPSGASEPRPARPRRRAPAASAPARRRPRAGDMRQPGLPQFGCKAYWQGMADCPGPHGEGADVIGFVFALLAGTVRLLCGTPAAAVASARHRRVGSSSCSSSPTGRAGGAGTGNGAASSGAGASCPSALLAMQGHAADPPPRRLPRPQGQAVAVQAWDEREWWR